MTKEELEKEADKWLVNNLHTTEEDYKQAYLAGAEPREKRIAELEEEVVRLRNEGLEIVNKYTRFAETDRKTIADLEAEVKEWKDKADLWCKTANLKDHNIMINKELEKENAELKERLKEHESIGNAQFWENVWSWKTKSDQLTKAKELLERLLITSCNSDVLNLLPNCSEVLRVRVEAEQFISEVEK